MKGLLTKDFSLFMQRKKFFALMMIAGAFMAFTSEDISFVAVWLITIMSIFALSTISYDEYDNSILFLMTTPISRKIYAIEKYVFGIMSGLIGWGYALAVAVIKAILTGNGATLMGDVQKISVFIVVILVMLSLSIPINFKWGSEKGRTVLFLVFGVGMAATFILVKFMDDKIDFERLFAGISPYALIIVTAAASIILTGISMIISIKIMENKEY